MNAMFQPPACPSMALIIEATADEFGVTKLDLVSERNQRSIARPRQVAMYLGRHLTTYSLPRIAKELNRDHTSVLHGVNRVKDLMATDPVFRGRVHLLMDALSRASSSIDGVAP